MLGFATLTTIAVSVAVGYTVSWWAGILTFLVLTFGPRPFWKRLIDRAIAKSNTPKKLAERERKAAEREARAAKHRAMVEGAARVARLADAYVVRTGRVPTGEQLREQEAFENSTVADRALDAWVADAERSGLTEAEIMNGISGLAALEAQLMLMSAEERTVYVESLPDQAKPTVQLAIAGIEAEERRKQSSSLPPI